MRMTSLHSFSKREAADLIAPVERKEILEALLNSNHSKALGPDGFNIQFYCSYWHIIRKDVVDAIMDFFNSSQILHQIKACFINFILKTTTTTASEHYRPIALSNEIYKTIARILISA